MLIKIAPTIHKPCPTLVVGRIMALEARAPATIKVFVR